MVGGALVVALAVWIIRRRKGGTASRPARKGYFPSDGQAPAPFKF